MSDAVDKKEEPTDQTKSSSRWKIQLGVLCGMLLLALVGMGLSQASENGVWEYWLFVIVVYAALGLWRSTRKAKEAGKPVKKLIGRELAHWAMLLVFIGVLVLLERREIIDRETASNISLLLLAFSCCLAGIHFDWLLLIMGLVLTIMLVGMSTLEQYSLVLWVVMIMVAIAAAMFFYLKSKSGQSSIETFE